MNSGRQEAVEALLHGHRCAHQLKLRLDDPSAGDGSVVSSEDLANTVLHCFSYPLSLLLTSTPSCSPTNPRKTIKEESEEYYRDDSPAPIYHDGFLWRKYGQKEIKASRFQRSYYRCAYKEQNCRARKHVQMIKDGPPVFRTTYLGRHSCQLDSHAVALPFALDYTDHMDSGRMIQFGKLDDQNSSLFPSSVNHTQIVKDRPVEYEVDVVQHGDDHQHMMKDDGLWPLEFYPPLSPGDMTFRSSAMMMDAADMFLVDTCGSF